MFGNVNKVLVMGRLTREPESRSFANGGKVTSFGLAINNRKKDANGDWVDDPVFVDVKAFDREKGCKLATNIEEYASKGQRIFLEGHLVLEQWEDRNGGGKRSKLVIVADNVQFLEARKEASDAGVAERSKVPYSAQDSYVADRGRDSFFQDNPF